MAETIRCWLQQTYQNFEIVVVNDESTDQTLSVLQNFNTAKLKVISVVNGGAARARNIAYKHSIGNYVIFFDADDYVEPTFLEEQFNATHAREDVVILADWGRFYKNDVCTLVKEISKHDEMTFELWIKTYWYNCNPMTNPGRAIIPRKIIEKSGMWNEELTLNDDLEFFTRVFLNVKKIILNKKAILHYRSGVSGLSGTKNRAAYHSFFKSFKISIDLVSSLAKQDHKIRQSCANMWQSFVYEVYPNHTDFLKKAQSEINLLCKPNISYHTGGISKWLMLIFGWKTVKKIKQRLKQ